ncbi:uncharacterized protein [Antennarius striatus]|uniref:uncharacterized protein n=1 Tax=Antennarius striatus TaxID=241820 RepID=UPI0035B1F206
MAVQIDGQESHLLMLGVVVNGGWAPFVSEECANVLDSNPGELSFLIPYGAPCISSGGGYHLHLVADEQEYILSCPAKASSQLPTVPPSSSSASTVPTTLPSQPPTTEQIAQLTEYPHNHYPVYQYPQLPQIYPPGPQPARPPQPTHGSPPGPQQLQSLYPMWLGQLPYTPEDELKYPPTPSQPPTQAPSSPNPNPVQDSSSHAGHELPVGPPQYSPDVYYSYVLYNHAVTPAPTSAVKKTTTTPPPTQLPKPPHSLPAQLKQPQVPHFSLSPFYLPSLYDYYSHYGQFPHVKPAAGVQPAFTSHPTAAPPLLTTTTMTRTVPPKQPDRLSNYLDHFYPQKTMYFYPPTPPPHTEEKPQTHLQEPPKTETQQIPCLPYTRYLAAYYPYLYYPYFYPFYPPYHQSPFYQVPQYPQSQLPETPKQPLTTITLTATSTTTSPSTTSSTTSSPTELNPHVPHLQCLKGKMVAFLPFADPDSIQVRDQLKTWLSLSNVSTLCGYTVQMAGDMGVMLHSPLPACHSEQQPTTTLSLLVRYWDLPMGQYRTLDLQCSFETTPETPVPTTTTMLPPSTTKAKVSPTVVPEVKVFCSSHQMTMELPQGPISGIVFKDIEGSEMNLQDAEKHCGYTARKLKDGKIHLRLRLQTGCHMSLQDNMFIITVVYTTVNGRQESLFSCPVLISGSEKECSLPSEQRLPCGPSSISQSRCLSMGCCFSKQPPACYYPMDECTIDRHFVFTVPASLTEPPLSPALLVSAGNSTCKPERVTSDYALFKIPMDGCGTHRVMVGKTMIYMVEIINEIQAISLNYGTITRDSPVRLLVECRYLPSTVLSVSYMVKTPSLGPAVHTQGVFGVQLRIARDPQYSSYYPQYHQPLQILLGKPLYLEVRLLNTPDPSLVLLVHFCVAYPRSGTAVWLLLYNGCPNPLDPALQQAVISDPQPPPPQSQTRRFTIRTFQFLPDGDFKDPEEEIYFMCSTEICSPRDGPCIEGCFGE